MLVLSQRAFGSRRFCNRNLRRVVSQRKAESDSGEDSEATVTSDVT